MILFSVLTTLLYSFLIGRFAYGFDNVKLFDLDNTPPETKFSIIIPFRNEAENLPDLLKSIAKLNYPKQLFEIILINDNSYDNSVEIIQKHIKNKTINLSIIQNKRTTNAPKKDAITTAINHAKNEWIITTDADCILPKNWLNSFNTYIKKTNALCIVAPVILNSNTSFLQQFQLLDFLSLQGATIGAFGIKKPFLCNGANFAYKKTLFFELHGFNGNTHIASGDDIFMLEKILKNTPKQLHYLKSKHAIITTKPQTSWSLLISQRVRWAAKTSAYNNLFSKLIGISVLTTNALITTSFLLVVFGFLNFNILIYTLVIKFNIDYYLIHKTGRFFNQKKTLSSYFLAFIIYPFFSTYIAFKSIFSSYTWKDRAFNK